MNECSDEGIYSQNIQYSSTRSHTSEEENRTRTRSKNSKCEPALTGSTGCIKKN